MNNKPTLLIMAGGTGGHIFPALAIAQAMIEKGWEVIWLGAAGKMETRIVPQYRITLETLAVSGVRGKNRLHQFIQPIMQLKAIWDALHIIARYRPDIAVGFGGFTSFSGGVAARLKRLPLIIHEQNAVAGLSNKLLSYIANRVLFAFPTAFPGRVGCVGNPVRHNIRSVPDPNARFRGRSGPLRLLVIGGSLGAYIFNQTVPTALGLLPEALRPHVVHQVGEQHDAHALKEAYVAQGINVSCMPFIAEMDRAYADADLVLCRAGALTVAELACVGVASILVPFPYAVDDHQTKNAHYLAQAGASILIRQTEFNPIQLAHHLENLNRVQCLAMATKARTLARPTATEEIVAVIEMVQMAQLKGY